jgi:hypothetical protein
MSRSANADSSEPVKSKEVASATIPGRFIFRARHHDSGGVSDRHLAKRFSPKIFVLKPMIITKP